MKPIRIRGSRGYVRHARAHLRVDPEFRCRLMLRIRAIVLDAGKEEAPILRGE
jgi:hypothetical protein